MVKCLVVGYGRAGKRHAKLAEEFGLDVYTCDPNVSDTPYVHFDDLEYALKCFDFDYVVIATPPDMHLEQIKVCKGISTLCEKPLCDLGQIKYVKQVENFPQVMVAFNYRYASCLQGIKAQKATTLYSSSIVSENYRTGGIPKWGLLLDHVSHAVDTLRFTIGDIEHLQGANHIQNNKYEIWQLWGYTDSGTFHIDEILWSEPHSRIAKLAYRKGVIDIDANSQMFTNMWQAFLNGSYYPNIQDALQTQMVLQEAWDISQ